MSKNRNLGNYGSAALIDADTLATPNTAVKRTAEGKVKTVDATDADDAVAFGQLGTAAQRNVMTSLTDAVTPNALMPRGAFGLGTEFKVMNLVGTVDGTRFVMGLVDVSNSNPGVYARFCGKIDIIRSNGIEPPIELYVNIQKIYNQAMATFNIEFQDNLSASQNITGIRGCVFSYNSKTYAGIEIFVSATAKDLILLSGHFGGNVEPFLVNTYNIATNTVLNAEINGSINYGVPGYAGRSYTQANAVGIVSQYGGSPTGAIIEQGSNANGNYVKFANGTMFCYKRIQFSGVTINPANGSNAMTARQLDVTSPANFVGQAIISPGRYGLYDSGGDPIYAFVVSDPSGFILVNTGHKPSGVWPSWTTTGTAVATQGFYEVFFIGRWF